MKKAFIFFLLLAGSSPLLAQGPTMRELADDYPDAFKLMFYHSTLNMLNMEDNEDFARCRVEYDLWCSAAVAACDDHGLRLLALLAQHAIAFALVCKATVLEFGVALQELFRKILHAPRHTGTTAHVQRKIMVQWS